MTVPEHRTDGGSDGLPSFGELFDPEELRSRNPSTVAMDALYLFATAFFATLFVRGLWPAVIAAVPLGAILYFGWHSSKPFFVAELLVIAITVIATAAGVVPV